MKKRFNKILINNMMMRQRLNYILILCVIFLINGYPNIASQLPRSAHAGQGHEDCSLCHSVHQAKDTFLFSKAIGKMALNPHTGEDLEKIDALCMMCHAGPPVGDGIREIDPVKKHPFGIKPVFVNLPHDAKGFSDDQEKLSCLGCHAPHPSNRNIAYLRTPEGYEISKKEDVSEFCYLCHPNMDKWLTTLPAPSQRPPVSKKAESAIPTKKQAVEKKQVTAEPAGVDVDSIRSSTTSQAEKKNVQGNKEEGEKQGGALSTQKIQSVEKDRQGDKEKGDKSEDILLQEGSEAEGKKQAAIKAAGGKGEGTLIPQKSQTMKEVEKGDKIRGEKLDKGEGEKEDKEKGEKDESSLSQTPQRDGKNEEVTNPAEQRYYNPFRGEPKPGL